MSNYLKTATKKTKQAPPTTPSRLQGNQKKSKQFIPVTKVPVSLDASNKEKNTTPPTIADIPTETTNWKVIESKTTNTQALREKKAADQMKTLLEGSDSESEAEDADISLIVPEKNDLYLLATQSVSMRYSLTLELDASLDPIKFLKATISKLNLVTKRITSEGQLAGYAGKAMVTPWEDTEVYSNRTWHRIKKNIEHTKLLPFFGNGLPKGRKQDTNVTRKYCRVRLAWISPDALTKERMQCLQQYLSVKRLYEPESFSLSPAPSMAINPTIAVQFRNSVTINGNNWNDKGHEDCLEELNKMIRSFLPPATVAGLKKVTFATGHNFMKGDPSMLSVECDKAEEQAVTRDLLQAFRSVNWKSQIRDKSSVPWIAIPYFKGVDIQSNTKYQPQYVEIKAKESVYQSEILMKYLDNILELDTVASPHFHVTKEVLKQMEQEIWDHNETPV